MPSSDPAEIGHDVDVATHELVHVLGFSSILFGFFRDENGNPRTPRCPSAPGCTGSDWDGEPPYNRTAQAFAVSSSTVLKTSRRGAPVTFLVTPAVRSVARAYFDCMAVPGAELEDGGGSAGTAGSHWEKRAFLTEIMTGSISSALPEILSEFTLALLADSGWYRVDYAAAAAAGRPPLTFGRGLGCAFLDTACATASAPPYCRAPPNASASGEAETGCTFDRAAVGRCVGDPLMDGCGVFYPYSNTRCDNRTGATSVLVRCGAADCRGSQYGPGTACFASNVTANGYTGSAPAPALRLWLRPSGSPAPPLRLSASPPLRLPLSGRGWEKGGGFLPDTDYGDDYGGFGASLRRRGRAAAAQRWDPPARAGVRRGRARCVAGRGAGRGPACAPPGGGALRRPAP
jgi:hypothetical protein